jgi:hypothetical protein
MDILIYFYCTIPIFVFQFFMLIVFKDVCSVREHSVVATLLEMRQAMLCRFSILTQGGVLSDL